MELKRVVVTGLGALTPLGKSVPEYWDGLVNGVSGAAPITRFDASKFKTQFACEVKGYDPENYFERKEARKMDLFSQFALVVADEAVHAEDADSLHGDPSSGTGSPPRRSPSSERAPKCGTNVRGSRPTATDFPTRRSPSNH